MAHPITFPAYAGHYATRAAWLRRVLCEGYMISADGRRYDFLNGEASLMVAYAIRSMESERGPVTPLREVTAVLL